MEDLLDLAIEAHGGIETWNRFSRLTATLRVGGAIWGRKGQPGFLEDVTSHIDIRQEKLSITRGHHPRHSMTFAPGRITFEPAHAGFVESCYNVRSAFLNQTAETPWNKFHAAYFSSCSLWTSLTSPFLFRYPGVTTEELNPRSEAGETWRCLRVEFPDNIVGPSCEQLVYFGPDGHLRRSDHVSDLMGGARSVSYYSGYAEFQGIRIPTVRQTFCCKERLRVPTAPPLVKIDVVGLHFEEADVLVRDDFRQSA